ncbi:Uncharacterised protein [Vibrio cholerae]|nr:Uncharacterised protein [Vibrio cholerae]CSC69572.1 Uncharacterised protein [Vibrio cholerae]
MKTDTTAKRANNAAFVLHFDLISKDGWHLFFAHPSPISPLQGFGTFGVGVRHLRKVCPIS